MVPARAPTSGEQEELLAIQELVLCLVAQLSLTVISWTVAARLLCPWGFSRQEYWSGLLWPPPGDLPNPEIVPRSPALQADLGYISVGKVNLFEVIFFFFNSKSKTGRNYNTVIIAQKTYCLHLNPSSVEVFHIYHKLGQLLYHPVPWFGHL